MTSITITTEGAASLSVRIIDPMEDVTSPAGCVVEITWPRETALRAEDYPVLAAIWDNEGDAVYDVVQPR